MPMPTCTFFYHFLTCCAAVQASAGKLPEISLDEFQKHVTQSSLWVVYGGIVYDVTSFAAEHPGMAGLHGVFVHVFIHLIKSLTYLFWLKIQQPGFLMVLEEH